MKDGMLLITHFQRLVIDDTSFAGSFHTDLSIRRI